MRFSISTAGLMVVSFLAATAVHAQISTNNGVSACVQFGSCSTGGPYATTELQKTPVTSPASSAHIAQPTNAAESSAYISNLAATGGAAAYSSRVANGEGSGNAPNGATSVPLTGVVIAGTTPGSAPSTSGTGSSGSADASFKLDSGFQGIWTAAVACVAVVAGALIVL